MISFCLSLSLFSLLDFVHCSSVTYAYYTVCTIYTSGYAFNFHIIAQDILSAAAIAQRSWKKGVLFWLIFIYSMSMLFLSIPNDLPDQFRACTIVRYFSFFPSRALLFFFLV